MAWVGVLYVYDAGVIHSMRVISDVNVAKGEYNTWYRDIGCRTPDEIEEYKKGWEDTEVLDIEIVELE